jgi:hypothetical protein
MNILVGQDILFFGGVIQQHRSLPTRTARAGGNLATLDTANKIVLDARLIAENPDLKEEVRNAGAQRRYYHLLACSSQAFSYTHLVCCLQVLAVRTQHPGRDFVCIEWTVGCFKARKLLPAKEYVLRSDLTREPSVGHSAVAAYERSVTDQHNGQ